VEMVAQSLALAGSAPTPVVMKIQSQRYGASSKPLLLLSWHG